MKRSDVTENPLEWLLGENYLIQDPTPYFIVLAVSVKTLEVMAIHCLHDLTLPGEPGQFHLWPGIGQGS